MKRLALAAAAALITVILPAAAFCADGYEVPDVSGATLVLEEVQYVEDNTPPTEITIRTYSGPDGSRFREYSVSGSVFRYDVNIDGKAPYEYRLLDDDGDGVFETKERLVGEMTVREKAQKFFIDLGPEPGKEYRYKYEDTPLPPEREQRQMLSNYPIYIPAWVILKY